MRRDLGRRAPGRRAAAPVAAAAGLEDLRGPLERGVLFGGGGPGEGSARQRVAPAVLDLCRVGVLPYWPNILRHLRAEREGRSRVAMNRGVELLLSTLHPKADWTAPVLEVPGGPERDVHLDGRGLVLVPSLFLTGRCAVLLDPVGADRPVLVFAATPDVEQAAHLWRVGGGGNNALGALMGQTRAAALQALAESCTTGELAERLGISSAGASQHASVLRQAGLITTRRNRHAVLHTLTSLGAALLDGDGTAVPA
ncbi:ArsR/SmtB family transcription factor [Actinosynnema sp. NPDC059797]